jgi:hypothetical protein
MAVISMLLKSRLPKDDFHIDRRTALHSPWLGKQLGLDNDIELKVAFKRHLLARTVNLRDRQRFLGYNFEFVTLVGTLAEFE